MIPQVRSRKHHGLKKKSIIYKNKSNINHHCLYCNHSFQLVNGHNSLIFNIVIVAIIVIIVIIFIPHTSSEVSQPFWVQKENLTMYNKSNINHHCLDCSHSFHNSLNLKIVIAASYQLVICFTLIFFLINYNSTFTNEEN